MIRIGDFRVTDKQREIVNQILDSGRLTEGPWVEKLERKMEEFLGVKHAILTTNGTVSLQLISHLYEPGLTVCVPAMTFPATINAFLATGKNVVLCDIGEDLQIDIDKLTDKQKKEIDIIVPVHLMGYTANMKKIMEEAEKYNWTVIEDTAEAFGAKIDDKYAGTIGDFGSYSFYVSHNIGCGELGMVVTNNDYHAMLLRSIKNHGRVGDSLKFLHSYIGSNYKTTEFMAGICYANMENVKEILDTRIQNCEYFFENTTNENIEPFNIKQDISPLGYAFKCNSEAYKNYVCAHLKDAGIETRDIFPCLANQEAFKHMFKSKDYPIADELEKRIFYIGCHQYLTEEEKKLIVETLNSL